MIKPITLASGQFGHLNLEELCKFVSNIGYNGLELATHSHLDISRAIDENNYIDEVKNTLSKYSLDCFAISSHLVGQCVGDLWEPRLDNFVPNKYKSNSLKIRAWAIEEMKNIARVANKMGVKIVTGFTGSPLWRYWYSYPQTTREMIDEGYDLIYELWSPIFDEFDKYDIKFALEVHPTEIAFDYYSTKALLEKFNYRKTLGINFDPSHLVWQGVNELEFLKDFSNRIYHVHMKDVKIYKNDRAGILGSHLDFGDSRRKWNFVSVGHGDVDFDGIIRILNENNYDGPLSIEWEDSGMDSTFGVKEAFEYVTALNYNKSNIIFDESLHNSN